MKLGNFFDIVHFFTYHDHILLVFKHGYETGQAATPYRPKPKGGGWPPKNISLAEMFFWIKKKPVDAIIVGKIKN